MITTVADFLQQLMAKEVEVLAQQPDLNHMPMLGDMYEGLARELLSKALFKGLDLRVTQGKIKFNDGTLSGQIDCMIVVGQGHNLPYTQHYIYKIEQLIAVVEVKKTLYGEELFDSMLHLRGLHDPCYQYNVGLAKLAAAAWIGIMGRPYPSRADSLSRQEDMTRHVINIVSHQPIRIVLGYDGFKSEHTLRNGCYRILMDKSGVAEKPAAGFGIPSFPNLIICRSASLIRLDGMPYVGPISNDSYWTVIASTSGNPFGPLLEQIWTHLSYLFDLPCSIYGEDLEIESFNRCIDARWGSREGVEGWEYRFQELSDARLNMAPTHVNWEPHTISRQEFTILNKLINGHEVRLDDSRLAEYLAPHGLTIEEIVRSLSSKRLAGPSEGRLSLLAEEPLIIFRDGRCLVAENNTGRFSRWIAKRLPSRSS